MGSHGPRTGARTGRPECRVEKGPRGPKSGSDGVNLSGRAPAATKRRRGGTPRRSRGGHAGAKRMQVERDQAGMHRGMGPSRRSAPPPRGPHLTSTLAPASSSFFLISAASSLPMPSLRVFGAPSTRSFASLRPSPVSSRTILMTLILLGPASPRTTSNSVFSSTAAAAPPPAAAAPATPLGLELLHELRDLDDRKVGKVINDLFTGNLSHFLAPSRPRN